MNEDLWEFFKEAATAEPWHVERYVRSAEWIRARLTPGLRLFDAGGTSPFSAWLAMEGVRPVMTGADLRYRLPIGDGTCDAATCMEVVEHLKDQDRPDNRDTFDGSGIRNLLEEMHRIVRPGGWLFLTTPNVGSLRGVVQMLKGQHPFQYWPHHRELAPADVVSLLTGCGWRIVRRELLRVWEHGIPLGFHEPLHALRERLGGDPASLDGDDLFVLAEKL